MVTLYGIQNCDTVRKARHWLDKNGVEYSFHDLRKDGLNTELVSTWSSTLGWKSLINKRGMTWRQLPDNENQDIDENKAINLMTSHPTLIKRPLLDTGFIQHLGFDEHVYAQLLL